MPIFDLPYDDMQKQTWDNTCVCGAELTVAFIDKKYALRCANNLQHNMIKRREKYPEYLRKEIYKIMTTELARITKPQMLRRIDSVKWPKDLTPALRELLADVAIERGLDPTMGELMIYQGKPYVCIDGRRRKAQDTGELDGIHKRPGTKQEKLDRGLLETDYLTYVEVWKKGCGHAFEAWGTVTREEIDKAVADCRANNHDPYSLPVYKNPAGMADKRGEATALREAFHLPLPSAEDIPGGGPEVITKRYDAEGSGRELGDEKTDYGNCPVHNKPFKAGQYGPYCPTKIEGKWCKEKPQEKAPDEKASKQPVSGDSQPQGSAVDSKLKPRAEWDKVAKEQVTDYVALEPIFCKFTGLSTKDMYAELGVNSRSDMSIPAWEAFLTLKDTRYPKDTPIGGSV